VFAFLLLAVIARSGNSEVQDEGGDMVTKTTKKASADLPRPRVEASDSISPAIHEARGLDQGILAFTKLCSVL
jgi:hypothetical protein